VIAHRIVEIAFITARPQCKRKREGGEQVAALDLEKTFFFSAHPVGGKKRKKE